MKYVYTFAVDARGSLRVFITYMKRKFSYSLGVHVDKSKWDMTMQRCKRNTTHGKSFTPAIKINAEIQRYEETIQSVANSFKESPTIEDFKAALDKEFKREKKTVQKEGFFDLYERYIREQGSICNWSDSVLRNHNKILKEWKLFDAEMSIDKINPDTIDKFTIFQIRLGHQNETTNKKISMSKWFFRWLVAKGLLADISFTAHKTHLKRSSRVVVFLTWEELMKVYNHTFERPNLSRARDFFCLCCFTSLRYSDAAALKKTDIYDDAIHITTQKTNDKITIELNNYSRTILQRYADNDTDKALPVISNQNMNVYVKEVCRQCGINEKLTDIYYIGEKKYVETKEKWEMIGTHSGRRTFICNALMLGIAPNVVMKWTGHSDYKSMQPYIDIADEAKKTAMDLFNK
ncbi:site-specific integrase [Phocaeicola plebeius]